MPCCEPFVRIEVGRPKAKAWTRCTTYHPLTHPTWQDCYLLFCILILLSLSTLWVWQKMALRLAALLAPPVTGRGHHRELKISASDGGLSWRRTISPEKLLRVPSLPFHRSPSTGLFTDLLLLKSTLQYIQFPPNSIPNSTEIFIFSLQIPF